MVKVRAALVVYEVPEGVRCGSSKWERKAGFIGHIQSVAQVLKLCSRPSTWLKIAGHHSASV